MGKGIFYGAARSEAANTHGLDVQIIGAGNSAGQAAMSFSSHARSVTILYRGETLELFIFIGADAETAWLPPEITLDQKGYVLTGSDVRAAERWQLERDPYLLETSVPGIFACGDVRFSPVKRVAAAVGEGSMAIAFVHQYLKDTEARSDPA